MPLELVTAPATDAALIDEVKEHMRVTIADDDAQIAGYIDGAIASLDGPKGLIKRALVTQTWRLHLDGFYREIVLPLPPLQSVTHIKYYDLDGVQQTLSSSVYTVDANREPGRISLAYDESWPPTYHIRNAVEIEFIAGYGDDWNSIPDDLGVAIAQVANLFYDYREPILTGTIQSNLPFGAQAIIDRYRVQSRVRT